MKSGAPALCCPWLPPFAELLSRGSRVRVAAGAPLSLFPEMHRCGRRTSFSSKRSLRRFVDSDRLSNQRLEGGLIDFLSLVDVDRAPYLSLETRASCGDQLET